MDDADLVMRVRAGEQAAWEELVDQYSDLLWRVARATVADDGAASDAMQTAWLRLLENIDRIANPAAVRSWLCTTTRREAIALSKALRRQQAADPQGWAFDEPTGAEDDPAAKSAISEQNEVVLAELAKLSERCRSLLSMHAHKISYDEIAQVMGMAIGSIGPTKARCMERLRRSPAIIQLEAAR